MGDNKISEAVRFTKRPVTIEAMKFDGSAKSASAICQWVNAGDDPEGHEDPTISYTTTDGDDQAHDMIVWTLEDAVRASPGDWIIKGVKGEFYPCKPDIFELTYSPHLQGEAVPVAYIVPSARVCHDGSMEDGPDSLCFADEADDYVKRVGAPLYAHPQPAELSEVSGGSGELGHLEVRRFIAKRVTSPEHRQNVLDGDYDETDWFGHVRAALNVGREQNPQSPVAWRRRHPKEDGTWFDWIYSDGEPARKYQTSQYEPLFALAATGKQQVGEVHPDDAAVDAFAVAMKEKMAAARGKGRGGWEDPAQCSADDLSRMLRDHVDKGDPRDVANFCMMLHQRGEAIASRQPEVK